MHAKALTSVAWVYLCCVAVALGGCARGHDAPPEETRSAHALSILYGKYRGAHGGRTPGNREDFLNFVAKHEMATLEQFGITDAKQLLISPGGGELVLVAGNDVPAGSDPIIAFEPQPIGGKRTVIRSYAGLEAIDESAFQKEKPGK
jgi:hypothetical protein